MKDAIDFGRTDIPRLFRKILFPTLLGMIFSAVFIITDGIFVGKGIGSDALAAVNITAPLFMVATGIGLMFGVGASVVASVHLAQGKPRVASINITQALAAGTFVILLFSGCCFLFAEQVGLLLGSSRRLLPAVVEYMHWYLPFLVFYLLLSAGMFFVRLDGSPKYAMMCNAVAAVLNILLDYIFIFRLGWGMMGAAFATSLGTLCGGMMTLLYLARFSRTIALVRIKLSRKSLRLTRRNIGYMLKLGSSGFLSEIALACMMFLGNYVFMRHTGEDGVAAFSIVCYFSPIIFMVYNAIAQSAQPIISYNMGACRPERTAEAFALAKRIVVRCGLFFFAATLLCNRGIIALFISPEYAAFDIAAAGIPYFAAGYVFFGFNIVGIGYYQSIGLARRAALLTLLRGVVLLSAGFLLLPEVLGVRGIWLAVPAAELLTTLCMSALQLRERIAAKR